MTQSKNLTHTNHHLILKNPFVKRCLSDLFQKLKEDFTQYEFVYLPNFCRCSTKMESYYGYRHHHDLSLLYWNCLGETWMSRALWAFEWRCNRWFFYDSWGSWAGIKRLKQLNFGTWQTYRTHAQLFRVVLWITRIDWTPICPCPKWRQWTKKHTLQNLPIISIINIRRGMKSDF